MPEKSLKDVIMGGNSPETLHTPKRHFQRNKTAFPSMHRRHQLSH